MPRPLSLHPEKSGQFAMLQYLSNRYTSWKFIVAKSPWWGGFYERMVQTVKRPLRKIIGISNLYCIMMN